MKPDFPREVRLRKIVRPLFLVKIRGESMWPALVPGKTYLASGFLPLRAGDFAVFKNPRDPGETYVKKIKGLRGFAYEMEGLVSFSSSSRDFGVVDKRDILGKLLWKTSSRQPGS